MQKLDIEAFDKGYAYGLERKLNGDNEGEPELSLESV